MARFSHFSTGMQASRVLYFLLSAFYFLLLPAMWRLFTICVILALLCGCETTPYNITDFNTVVVDAGHGGHDSGAFTRGRGPRIKEKDLTLDMAQRVNYKLQAAGFRTVMTRSGDYFITLDNRVSRSNTQRKSVFVSIHFNYGRRRGAHGAETYHNARGTWQLAERIQCSLATMPYGMNRGVHTASYWVLRKSEGPAILVECGFLSNAAEAKRCANPAWREEAATRIANAIIAQRQPPLERF